MRNCNCSGNCGPQNHLTRRDFIGMVSAGAAATMVPKPVWAAFELPADELERWRRQLSAESRPRLYSSARHTDARMHLGGIGTGNFEIGADGQFTTWQLFNTLRDGHVPFHFLAKAGGAARLLQTAGGPDWPRVRQIEMTGEYPCADLRFVDPDLPVNLELSAFSPFAPLDARFSSMPLVAFIFKVRNPTRQKQTVSLAALMQNPVGYDAAGENNSGANACFGWNVNELLREGHATGLFMRAEAGSEPDLDAPVTVYASSNLKGLMTPPMDRPKKLALEVLSGQALPVEKMARPSKAVIWLEEPPVATSETFLRQARQAVEAGATLVFSGKTMPLLQAYAGWTQGKPIAEAEQRPDLLFEDFEKGYENWKVEGTAFGPSPAQGTLPNQNPVSGFVGKGLVNTYFDGDDSVGRLTSKSFTINRRFIRFLIGGGAHANTQIRLVVDGKVARATAGRNDERLEPVLWDVSQFEGQSAQIEIVDQQKGGWGHINGDQIEFSDLPGSRELMVLLEDLLPARFSAIRAADDSAEGRNTLVFENLALQTDATLEHGRPGPAERGGRQNADGGVHRSVISRPLGKGRVVIVAGAVLEPEHAQVSHWRQRAYALLSGLVGAKYTASAGQHSKAPGFGTLALAALAGKGTVLSGVEHRIDGWKMFNSEGRFGSADAAKAVAPTPIGRTCYGGVCATVQVPAGAQVEIPFLLAWHYPNKYSNHHDWMGCHYATPWDSAREVVREAADNLPSIRGRTELFRKTFYDSTIPYWLLDCLTANAAILRHVGVVFRIANGDVYGWEGSNGCCQPTCAHVWGYEQTLARLFPELERDMRRIDLKHQQRPDGGVNNRTEVPSPPRPTGEHPFADGHASCILKAYREALNHPDDGFLKEYWPHIKRAVEYLIERDAKGGGGEPGGFLQDDQWNTYDEALHGVTTFISGYYLAALRAGEEWARRVGDAAPAERFRAVFEKGKRRLVELCWNGDYFQQHLPDYLKRRGEVGPGCMADQVIGQWWAHQLGLGYILPKDNVAAALRGVFRYNFKSDLTGWPHAPRAFAGEKDKGLIVCTWPKGGRPDHVMLYSDEVWTGLEYQVAAHMIYEGLVEEGLAIVKAARDRYDGVPRPPIQRNPWNEIECGGHYVRAMSSWSLLLALSGWEYDGPGKKLRFTPRYTPGNFKSFFAGPEGWGNLRQERKGKAQRNEIAVKEGRLGLGEVTLAVTAQPARVSVELGGRPIAHAAQFTPGLLTIGFKQPVVVRAGQTLLFRLT